jgi:hypothetical protein
VSLVTLKLIAFTLLHFGVTIGAVVTLHRPPRFRRAAVEIEDEEACDPGASGSGGSSPGPASI